MNNIEDRYTSLELSKKLKEAGCQIESGEMLSWFKWRNTQLHKEYEITLDNISGYQGDYDYTEFICSAFDILNDICCVHADKFFDSSKDHDVSELILRELKRGNKEEAEAMIWRHTRFNPENED